MVDAIADGVAGVRLNDRENANCLGDELCADLEQALARLGGDPAVRAVVLSGAPDLFSAGASRQTLERLAVGATAVRDLALPARLIGFPVPIIAALEGDAVGGGLMLALSCDMRIAAENRRFGLNFTTLGFTPGMGATGLLPSLVGHAAAVEMLLTGKFYKGRELAGTGLFNAVVSGERVRETAIDCAVRIAERPRHVIALVKDALAQPRLRLLQDALEREHRLHQACFAMPGIATTIAEEY